MPSSPRPASPASRRLRALLLSIALSTGAGLAGCSTTGTAPADEAQTTLDAQRPLHLSGRFSISHSTSLPEPKTEHNSGRFSLHRDGDNLGIELYSPFGQTLVRAAQRNGEAAWLETAQRQRLTGPSLQDTIEQAIGIPVPADRLPDWLSDRFQTVLERSPDGQRIRAREAGWQIERDGRRWFLVWHENTRRLEIRLVLDAVQQPTPGAPPAPDGSTADQPAPVPVPAPDSTRP